MSDRSENGPLRVGEVFLEKYQILGLIGRGGHACVYRALNLFMGREVAVKVISRLGGLSEELRQRGRQEAALLGKLSHPNIVRVYDAGISDSGSLYIVMELLEGQTVADHLRDCGPVTVPEGLRLLGELCDALSCAHEAKAIHRDLKPANIFLTTEGTPKILDFGVAKIAGAVGYQTQKNMVVGTMLYMSPEQLRGELATPRSDIYALGLIAFELFHGAHPLLLDELGLEVRDRRRLAWLQAKKPAPRLDAIIPDFPEYVARMVNTAVVKPPGRRFETARQLGALARQNLLRYETEVSMGYKVPARAGRRCAKPESIPNGETEQLFALGAASPGAQPSLSESSSFSGPVTASTCSLPAAGQEPKVEENEFEHSPPQPTSTSASVSFGKCGMNDRFKAGLVAALGFFVGMTSLVLISPSSESTTKDVIAAPRAEIVIESVYSGPLLSEQPQAQPLPQPTPDQGPTKPTPTPTPKKRRVKAPPSPVVQRVPVAPPQPAGHHETGDDEPPSPLPVQPSLPDSDLWLE